MNFRHARRLHELRSLVALAAPVVGVQFGLMLMGTVDAMMLGRVSAEALAAGALGNAVSLGILIPPMAVLMALDPLVAQAWGAGDVERLGRHLVRGVWLALALTLPATAVMIWAAQHLDLFGQPPALQTLSGAYLMALVPGNLAFLWFGVWRQSLQAMTIVRPALIAAAVANVFNAGANWALVFGNLGFPALGVRGSAIATSTSRWLLFAVLLVLSWPLLGGHLRGLFSRAALRWSSFLQLLRLGVPISVQVSVEFYMFMIVALMMGNLGSKALAAHQIAVNVASLAFMVPMGIGAAAATRVGNAIGRADRSGAQRAAAVALTVGAGVMVVFAVCFALFPAPLARLYTDELGVVALAAAFLPIAALFQVFDGTQVVAAGILRGTADTRIPATIAFFGFWLIGLPLGWWLTFQADFGPRGLWLGLTAGLATVAVLLVLRILQRFRQPIAALVEE